ncbi:hypothetical protein T261_6616 [Streptomyces lydicus]|nr:hypothetical protein T261_6616 [Streptomyces lydicus]
MHRDERALGAVLGSAVGDALGAPFEFGAPGAYTARFRVGIGAPHAGGGWDLGEATDDTQMAVLTARSLLERGGLDLPDLFRRFQRWAAAGPKDIGLQTEDVLGSGLPWDRAAAAHFETTGKAAGNGALMRAAPSAVYFAGHGRTATMEAGRRLSALTHGDPAAWEGTALFHELIRIALDAGDPLAAVPHALTAAVRAAIDLGGDTDTVAAVTGGLAGAVYGAAAIPQTWLRPLHVPLPGSGDTVLRVPELTALADELVRAGNRPGPPAPPTPPTGRIG